MCLAAFLAFLSSRLLHVCVSLFLFGFLFLTFSYVSQELWYSVLLFFLANFFLSIEKVAEEKIFEDYNVDVFVVFFYTLWTQVPTPNK